MPINDCPIGAVLAYAGPLNTIPLTWLLCDGSQLDRAAEPDLFNAIGTTWGGDGTPHFYLPDLRGQFLRGVDKNRLGQPSGVDPDSGGRAGFLPPQSPSNPGSGGNNVGSFQGYATAMPRTPLAVSQVSDHTHLDPTWDGNPGTYELAVGAARGPGGSDFIPANNTSPSGAHSHGITGGDSETRPKNAYVYWIIRVR